MFYYRRPFTLIIIVTTRQCFSLRPIFYYKRGRYKQLLLEEVRYRLNNSFQNNLSKKCKGTSNCIGRRTSFDVNPKLQLSRGRGGVKFEMGSGFKWYIIRNAFQLPIFIRLIF